MLRNKYIVYIITALLIFAISFFAIRPLLTPGFFTIHDDEQIARLYEMYLVLSQGQIPPRWIPDLGFGFGYPLYNFYPPFVYYLGSLIHFLGFSFTNATKIVMGIGFFCSAGFMFLWIRRRFGYIAGLFAALLYTYAPYHSVDIYVRGALSEFFTFVFVPAVLWTTDLLFEKKENRYIVLNSLFFALLILTHTLVILQFLPIYALYIGILLISHKRDIKQNFVRILISLFIGLGLTAYFWLPSFTEKQFTLVDAILTKELASYAIHFVCPMQLWSSPWGYGGSVAGCIDGLSFQAGKVQLILGGVGVFLTLFFSLRKKNYSGALGSAIFLFSLFMTLPFSKFIWDHVSVLWYIQFPWRYLLFIAVGSAFLGGYILSIFQRKWGIYVGILFAVTFSVLNIYQIRNYFQPQQYLSLSDAYYTSREDITWRVSRMSYEYVPKEVATRKSAQNTTELAISTDMVSKQSYSKLSANMSVTELENKSQLKRYSVNVYNTKAHFAVLQINTFNFPGWKVYVNGKEFNDRAKNSLDLIQIELPAGKYDIVVKFTDTPIRLASNIISMITLVGIFGYSVLRKVKKI